MNVVQLSGAQLDYWTGRAEGIPADQLRIQLVPRATDMIHVRAGRERYDPSTNPATGWSPRLLRRSWMRIGPLLAGGIWFWPLK